MTLPGRIDDPSEQELRVPLEKSAASRQKSKSQPRNRLVEPSRFPSRSFSRPKGVSLDEKLPGSDEIHAGQSPASFLNFVSEDLEKTETRLQSQTGPDDRANAEKLPAAGHAWWNAVQEDLEKTKSAWLSEILENPEENCRPHLEKGAFGKTWTTWKTDPEDRPEDRKPLGRAKSGLPLEKRAPGDGEGAAGTAAVHLDDAWSALRWNVGGVGRPETAWESQKWAR